MAGQRDRPGREGTNGSNASDVGRREGSRGVWSGAGASSDEDNASLL